MTAKTVYFYRRQVKNLFHYYFVGKSNFIEGGKTGANLKNCKKVCKKCPKKSKLFYKLKFKTL